MILQMIPTQVQTYAVFSDVNGEPQLKPVVCLACCEPEPNQRVISGVIADKHLILADWEEGFVGYAYAADVAPWVEPCKAKRDAIRKAAKNPSPIYVPPDNKKIVFPN